MEQQPHRAIEQTKSKQKQNQVKSHSNWPRVLVFELTCKKCNGIIKGWPHCLTSGSKGRFLVNIILMFSSAWCLVMARIQLSLIKKTNRRPEHSVTPTSPTSNNISFLSYHFCLFISPQKLFSFSRYLSFCLDFLVMYRNGLIKKIRLISNFMRSQSG